MLNLLWVPAVVLALLHWGSDGSNATTFQAPQSSFNSEGGLLTGTGTGDSHARQTKVGTHASGGRRAAGGGRGGSTKITRGGSGSGPVEVLSNTGEERKLRSSIASIVRDQDDLRLNAPWLSFKNVVALVSSVGIAGVASVLTRSPVWAMSMVPFLSSVMFGYASAAESSAQKSRGMARYNSGQAAEFAAQQEVTLAEAEQRKVGLPIGVGLTGIFAAVCVAIKFYEEASPITGLLNLLILVFSGASLMSAVYTSDVVVQMRKVLMGQKPTIERDEENEWERQVLPLRVEEASEKERLVYAAATMGFCLSPLILLQAVGLTGQAAVVVSATSAASAAVIGLFGEKEFSDAERRIAFQSKQASLAEMFYAQAQAEAAVLPMRSAWTGFGMASTALAVEFSTWASGIPIVPVLLNFVRSLASSKLVKTEADATFIEKNRGRTGLGVKRNTDTIGSIARELNRFQAEIFAENSADGSFDESIRGKMNELPIGSKIDFPLLTAERRRRVHLIAAEVGMTSQSVGTSGARVVRVLNNGVSKNAVDEDLDFKEIIENGVEWTKETVQDLTSKGLPANAGLMLAPAAIATAAGSVSPFLLEDAQADLLVPLVTGGVGMLTVWQERVGKLAVAVAKRDSAALEVKISKVKSLIGLAMITVRAMPTYLGVSTASMTAVALLGHEMPFLLFPALVTSAICMVLTKQRQRRVRRYTERAIREIDGVVPPKTLTGRWWWTLPAVAALIVPASVPIRIMAACSVMAGQIGLIFASSMSQIAASEYYMARTERVFSRADCWSQEASRSSRSLPLTSAAAIVNTILATSLVFVESDIGAIFPFLGLGVFAVSLQNGNTASSSASEVVEEVKTVQELKTSPVPWSEDRMAEEAFNPIDTTVSDSKSSALVATPGKVVSVDPEQNKWADDLLSDVLPKLRVKAKWSEFRETFVTTEPKLSERQLRRLWHAFRDDAGAKGGNREALRAVLLSTDDGNLTFPSVTRQGIRSGLKKAFRKVYYAVSESGPDRRYAPSSAQKAVSSVEADLEELCNSVRSSEKSWRRTGALISLLPATALISPLALSETLVEIILPLVGAALVLFVVAAEADTRSTISASKVWCAQLNQAAATVEELMATSLLYKSRVFALCGMGAAIAIGTIVAEHHWWHGFKMLQTVVQFGMVVAQGTLAAMAVPPLLRVIKQARRAEYMAETSDLTVPDDEAVTPAQFFKGKGPPKPFSKNLRRILTLGAIAPSILLAIFPLGKEFAKRSVASTAGGAFVTALALFLCEVYCAKAEKAQAMRLRTHALANTFAEEAEQQGAVLPLTSAATIAGAALVAFATELNPLVAGSITLLQGISWIVASRKALSTKFESAAATQVNPRVVTKEEGRKRENTGEELSRRIKRATLNMPI